MSLLFIFPKLGQIEIYWILYARSVCDHIATSDISENVGS